MNNAIRNIKTFALLCGLILFFNQLMAQQTDTLFLEKLMKSQPELFGTLLNHPDKNEVQILYTQINRDKHNKPTFQTYSYNLNDQRYFYPASTVKLAAVIFALEKMNHLGLSADLTMFTDSSYAGQTSVLKDESSASGLPSISHYIKKILLTSDNDAFNRLYEFIGRAELNAKLKKYGLTNSRIINRLAIGDGDEAAKHTNPVRFQLKDGSFYNLPGQYDPLDYPLTLTNLIVGKGYLNSKDELVNKPYSFENKNVFTITDQQSLMKRLMFPEAFSKNKRFNLKDEDYKLIYTYMSMLPTESTFPKYDPSEFWPLYAKMIYYGRDKTTKIDPEIRVFNKYGDSYGFIIDNSYLVDKKNGVEFLLTAVVQSNEDGIYNDNKYEYETVCYPFMKNLGRAIYAYELARKKQHLPDFSKLAVAFPQSGK